MRCCNDVSCLKILILNLIWIEIVPESRRILYPWESLHFPGNRLNVYPLHPEWNDMFPEKAL